LADHWRKKTASGGGFWGIVLIQDSAERTPTAASGEWPIKVRKAVAAAQ
jgi:hypothetical protein